MHYQKFTLYLGIAINKQEWLAQLMMNKVMAIILLPQGHQARKKKEHEIIVNGKIDTKTRRESSSCTDKILVVKGLLTSARHFTTLLLPPRSKLLFGEQTIAIPLEFTNHQTLRGIYH